MAGETATAPSFLAETAEETAEFNTLRDGAPLESEIVTEGEPKELATKEPEAKVVETKEPDKRPGFVPHAALHEERTKRQALEKELADLRAGKQPTVETKTEEIDPETDPIAALKQVRAYQEQQRTEARQSRELQEFDARVQTHEADFSAATPDYGDAVAFLSNARAQQIKASAAALGRTMPEAQLRAILLHEARQTSSEALQNGRNPGEVFYTLAKSFGYAPKAAPDTTIDTKAADVKIDPTPAPKAKESGETIDRLIKGQRAANKVSGGGEPAETGELSLEAGAKLEGAAFDKWFEKFSKSQKSGERAH